MNGRSAENVEFVRDDLITFDQPYDTLGTLLIEVTNDGRDFSQNQALRVELTPMDSGVIASSVVRDGDLLAAVTSLGTVQLFTTDESDVPSFLASVSLKEEVKDLALADGYLISAMCMSLSWSIL